MRGLRAFYAANLFWENLMAAAKFIYKWAVRIVLAVLLWQLLELLIGHRRKP